MYTDMYVNTHTCARTYVDRTIRSKFLTIAFISTY